MVDKRKETKGIVENIEVGDGSETMLKRPNFSEFKPVNNKQAWSKLAIYIHLNSLLYQQKVL